MFNNIAQVWQAIDAGNEINWANESYMVYAELAIVGNIYQANHFTNRNDKVLAIRCKSNYFGSLLVSSELGALFLKGVK